MARAKGPAPSSALASRRMRNTPTRDTPAELAIRRILYASGLRYRVDVRPEPEIPRKADIVFFRARVAVFIDGCFWHGCPEHGSSPKANAEWWRQKLGTNAERDRDTDARLRAAGWMVIRIWEHEPAAQAANGLIRAVEAKRGAALGNQKALVGTPHV